MRREIYRAVAAAGLVAGTTVAGAGSASAGSVDYDCPDFPNQSVAQVVFVEAGGLRGNDRFRLDLDNDLIACEDQFGGGSRDIEGLPPAEDLGFPINGGGGQGNGGAPVGGVDAGAGGTAGAGPEAPLLVTGAALTTVGVLAFAQWRRRRPAE